TGPQPARSAAARQDRPRGARVGAAARLRDRLWLCRLQRRRALGPGPGAQAAARARSPRGPRPGLPGDALPVRERRGTAGALSGGGRVGRPGHRAASRAAPGPRPRHRPGRTTLDLDPTDDPTHGQQEFSFFNGHSDSWCYLPVVATLTFNAEPTQYVVAAVLRPGNRPAKAGAIPLLRRLLARL